MVCQDTVWIPVQSIKICNPGTNRFILVDTEVGITEETKIIRSQVDHMHLADHRIRLVACLIRIMVSKLIYTGNTCVYLISSNQGTASIHRVRPTRIAIHINKPCLMRDIRISIQGDYRCSCIHHIYRSSNCLGNIARNVRKIIT